MTALPDQAQASTDAGFDPSAYRGKVIYLDFWASWCAPCKLSFPFLNALRLAYAPRDLAVITVNVDRDRPAAERFLRAVDSNLPVIWDAQGALATRYKIRTMPTSIVFDRTGAQRFVHNGYFDNKTSEYRGHVEQLLHGN